MVAEVTKVHPLKEGDYFYELEALPVAGNFDDLSLVFVIPPVSYDPDEQPPAFQEMKTPTGSVGCIIPTYKAKNHLKHCLTPLINSPLKPKSW